LKTQKLPKAIIFDMDGTMIDNMMVHHRAWQQQLAIEGFNYTLAEVIEQFHGKNVDIIERVFGDKYSPEERLRFSNDKEAKYREMYLPDLKLIDGLSQLLATAYENEIPMAIGTAAQYANVNLVLDTLNIRNYFNIIVADVDVQKGKPDPEVFLKVAQKLGIEPTNCLVFEDSPVGAKTAQNAGMKAIIITTTHKVHEFESYGHVIKCVPNYENIDILKELAYI
jgi:beta-phosphoglucomutase